ncbi:hypothetical protein SAMN04488028_10934 [Reichenbachiella agariperforans]|uniref:Uncharacterized protein n=1 Tax=Reichenbachiella agariperforans TaxID=156994 RepID=A0A1M6VFZ8_REIAG|nr:hypothetical protein SAMN04488028_10934 [Reichenbachiella agariperforans]
MTFEMIYLIQSNNPFRIVLCLQARQTMLPAGKRFFFTAKKGSKKARKL